MKRVIILGAGFAKAVGNLPLTSEMFDRFEQVLEECRVQKHNNQVIWGDKIFEFLHSLERQLTPHGFRNADVTVMSTDFRRNFEHVLTLIDMNGDLEITVKADDGTKQYDIAGYALSPVAPWSWLRGWMATYIYLALVNPCVNNVLLERFRQQFLSSDTTVITFNYDLILERFLFKEGLWSPHDGYGVQVQVQEAKQPIEDNHTSIPILKLHGSLNWEREVGGRLTLSWHDDHQQPFFPGYLKNDRGLSFDYQGAHSPKAWILPSWVKPIETSPLPIVWRRAARALEEADDICVIGYSLPPADAAVISLLSCVKFKCGRMRLIDPNANSMAERYTQITGLDVTVHSRTIEETLSEE